jgi:hypothetical protein
LGRRCAGALLGLNDARRRPTSRRAQARLLDMGDKVASAEDPNDVLILQDVADVAKARIWLGGDELKAAMTKAGVVASPNVRLAS